MPTKGTAGAGESARKSRSAQGGSVGDQVLLDALTALGLTLNESRAYLALLSAGEATAAEAAAQAAIPRPKVYEALSNLEGHGFCRSVGERVRRYTPIDPEIALGHWAERRDEQRAALADRDQANIELLTRQLPRASESPTVEIPDFIDALSGRLPTTEALEQVMASAQTYLHEILQPPFLQPRPRWNEAEIEAVNRGVQVRVVYTPDGITDPRRYQPLREAGGETRLIETVPMKLLISDSKEALVSLRDSNTGIQSLTTARIRHADLVAPLESLFERVWAEAKPIE